MALQEETKKVVSQFEFSDADVNSHVAEFIQQMSMLPPPSALPALCNFGQWLTFVRADTGLEQDGTSISQIPTYVTAVPNGTEKVCPQPRTP